MNNHYNQICFIGNMVQKKWLYETLLRRKKGELSTLDHYALSALITMILRDVSRKIYLQKYLLVLIFHNRY